MKTPAIGASIRLVAFTGLLFWAGSPAAAQNGLGAILGAPSAGGSSLSVSYCADEGSSWVECVTHDLSCENSYDLRLHMTGDTDSTQRVAGVVQDLLKGGYGNARLKFRVDGKEPGIDLRVSSIELFEQDLDGVWDIGFSFAIEDRGTFFDAITDSTKSLVAIVGDKVLEFAPRLVDVPKLQKFKEACLAKAN